RYQGAHVLLHALQFQTQSNEEKMCLNRYKEAVEKRLHILEDQGFIQAYTSAI
ncbi:Serine/threonineprotein kinase ULK2like, partial [Caligus rogercresseyi]